MNYPFEDDLFKKVHQFDVVLTDRENMTSHYVDITLCRHHTMSASHYVGITLCRRHTMSA